MKGANKSIRFSSVWSDVLICIVLFTIPFAVFIPIWAPSDFSSAYIKGDAYEEYWPDMVFISNSVREGSFPLWNLFERGGFPFCCDPQASVLYPLNWIFALASILIGSVSYVFGQIKILVHLGVAAVGMYLYLRCTGLRKSTSMAGAIAYQFGPFMVGQLQFSLIWPVAYLPFVLLFVDRLFKSPTLVNGLLLSLMCGLCIHAGSPPSVFYSFLVAFPYFLFRGFCYLKSGEVKIKVKKIALPLLLFLVNAMVFSLSYILPAYYLFKNSVRESRNFSYVSSGAIKIDNLLGLILKAGEARYIYAGISVFILAVVGFLFWEKRKEKMFFTLLFIFGMVLCLGDATPVLGFLCAIFPPFKLFRICYRYIFLVNVALPVLMAGGVESVFAGRVNRERLLSVLFPCVGILLVIALMLNTFPEVSPNRFYRMDMWFSLFIIVAVALWMRIRDVSSFAGTVVVLIVMVDLLTISMRCPHIKKGRIGISSKPPDKIVELMENDEGMFRVYNEFLMGMRPGSRFCIRDFRGYMGPLRAERYNILMKQLHKKPDLLRVYNVKYILHSKHKVLGYAHHHVKKPSKVKGIMDYGGGIYGFNDPWSYCYLTDNVRMVSTRTSLFDILSVSDKDSVAVILRDDLDESSGWDVLRRVFYDSGRRDFYGRIEQLQRGFNTVKIRASVSAGSMLVLNERWFEGWRSFVDGKRVRIYRVNYLMQGIVLDKGTHLIEFKFRPLYFIIPALSAAILLILSVVFVISSRRIFK